MSLAARLWRDSAEQASAVLEHPFVRGLADGSLARDAFAVYVAQDAYFLEAFARAYALALAHTRDRESLDVFSDLLAGVNDELRLHASYAAAWGVDMADVEPLAATSAYTDFLLSRAALGDVGLTCAAMTPCMRLYAHLGQSLDPEAAGPYRDWVETYASDDFEALARRLEGLLDRHAEDTRATAAAYRRAMRLEHEFFDAPLAAPGARHHGGVEYAVRPGFRPLELDLHLPPPGPGPAPVVVFVHGGGWQEGTRREVTPALGAGPFARLAAAGIAVASVGYRFSGEAPWPAQLDDVVAALRWLHREGGGLGLDPDRVALWGESAGGQLAAVAGLLADDPARGSGPVACVVDWYGPTDLRVLAAQMPAGATSAPDAGDSAESRLLGAALPTVPELATDASPVSHAHPGAPPFLIAHGTADLAVPAAQATALADALRALGAPVRLELLGGAGHRWEGVDTAVAAAVVDLTVTFLREHLTDGS